MSQLTTDVLVIGSGAAGMAAAIKAARDGRQVIVIEKEKYLGGTSAISGGWAWVPGNRQGRSLGDTREEVETYLRALAPETYNAELVGAFLDEVPDAMDFFETQAGLRVKYADAAPDYQMDLPGARESGRAVTFEATNARTLGPDRLRVRPYLMTYTVYGYMPEVGKDIQTFLKANSSFKAFLYATKRVGRTWLETLLFRRSLIRTNGNALMTQMISIARDLGVKMVTSAAAKSLITDVNGRVSGAEVVGDFTGQINARLGVVLASGGFSGNPDLRREFFPHDPHGINHFTPTVGHEGDSYLLARALGGYIDDTPHQPASWAPVTTFPGNRKKGKIFPHLRAFGLPGLIAINSQAERFANESLSYHDYGVEMLKQSDSDGTVSGWIIGDSRAMKKYGIGWAKPWPFPEALFTSAGYLKKAADLPALAKLIGAPEENLKETLETFNVDARRGEDSRFGRGSNKFHHFKGDLENKPNPNLAPIDKPPYYAVKIKMGDLGTYAGLAVDTKLRVLGENGEPIEGLYAIGTAAVSPFGGGYPGYGANIGPAMVFGYRVAKQLSEAEQAPTSDTANSRS